MIKIENQNEMSKLPDDIFKAVSLDLVPKLLVAFNLDELCLKDPLKAFSKLQEIIHEDPISDQELFLEPDFLGDRKYVFKRLKEVSDNNEKELTMLLFYLVHSFESMVNYQISQELWVKHFSPKETNDILRRLSTESKLSWFLKLICRKDYTKKNNGHTNDKWLVIKKTIEHRNFFIHYKPENLHKIDSHREDLNKQFIKSFMESSYHCYLYLKRNISEDFKKQSNRHDRVRKVIEHSLKNREDFKTK